MKITGLAFALVVAAPLAMAQDAAREAGGKLPAPVAEALKRAQVPEDHVALVVKEAGAKELLIAHNAHKAMNPASVIKLVTTYAGLELLGPAHTWKTEILASGELRGGTLTGDLILRGSGDPKLTGERFTQALKLLRERGLATIRGDLTLDKTAFEPLSHDPAAFDGEPLKPYNVGPDALLMQNKAVRFLFAATFDGAAVVIAPEPRLSQLEVVNRVKPVDGPCGDWRNRVTVDVQTPTATQLKVGFSGHYPRSCGEQVWSLALLDHARFVGGLFAQAWAAAGGVWHGAVRIAPAPADARLLTTLESPSLAEIVRDINKYSNNGMARQLFLSLSMDAMQAGGVERSAQRIKDWLEKKGIAANGLVLDNGSGLSRSERIDAHTLAALLDAAWRSAVMPEFIASLPLAGVDGTLRRRARGEGVAGQAHVKGGTLNDVRAIAGYVLDAQGKRWIVVFLIHHPQAGLATAAQEALLKWVAQGPPPRT